MLGSGFGKVYRRAEAGHYNGTPKILRACFFSAAAVMPAGQGAMKAAKTRLFRIMKNPTIVAGIAFGLGSIAQLLLGN